MTAEPKTMDVPITGWRGITFGTFTATREEWTRLIVIGAILFGWTLGRRP